ncbi:hypothetical protein NL108_006213 [Boleophthalmus pectinirostris]|nr:hypothetical protein NL108_006213 [Boleophthalmus pectinirostris]
MDIFKVIPWNIPAKAITFPWRQAGSGPSSRKVTQCPFKLRSFLCPNFCTSNLNLEAGLCKGCPWVLSPVPVLLLLMHGLVRPTDARSSWCRGGVYRPVGRWLLAPLRCSWPPPPPRLMSHELPVCLLLPAVCALPLPEQSLKHMLLRATEQPDRTAQPNAYKEQSCHFFISFLAILWASI